jgi:hypothetical protein
MAKIMWRMILPNVLPPALPYKEGRNILQIFSADKDGSEGYGTTFGME